jgi:putative DNA primase/helicase
MLQCPLPDHEDRDPSFSIVGERGWKCFGCNRAGGVSDLIVGLGLANSRSDAARWLEDKRGRDSTPWAPVATYAYTDESGKVLYEAIRRERVVRGEREKAFAMRAPLGNGAHTYKIANVPRRLYRLPEVLAAKASGQPIVVVEGEKDADRVSSLGFAATTNAGGAGWKWTSAFAEPLREAKRIVVITDSDAVGRAAAFSRASLLTTLCHEVSVLDLAPEREDGYDVSDWLDEGHSQSDLREKIMDAAPFVTDITTAPSGNAEEARLVMNRLSEVQAEIVRPLWTHRIFYGEPFLLSGPPGVGKSFVSAAIATAVTRGVPLPGGGDINAPGDVVVLALEDDAARVLRPRYDAMGADVSRLHIIRGVRIGNRERLVPFSLEHIDELQRELDGLPEARLVIIDPVMRMLAGADTHRSNEVREMLDPFLDATSNRGIAVCLVTHTNKSVGVSGSFRVEGSLGGFVGRARSVLSVGISPDGNHGIGLLKSNLGRMDVPVIGFNIDETGRFSWSGEDLSTTASELFEPLGSDHERSASEDVREAILSMLSVGERTATELSKALRSQGHSDRTVERVRANLKRSGAILRVGGGVAGEVRWRIAADH